MASFDNMMSGGSAFWQFSLALYQRPQVQRACLDLQDDGGADVNIVLYLLFAASEGRRLSEASILALDCHVAPWRETVVRPLRQVRRRLKEILAEPDVGATDDISSLRSNIKGNELIAEKIQQQTIFEFGRTVAAEQAPWHEAAQINLQNYETVAQQRLPVAGCTLILSEFSVFMKAAGD